MEDEDLKKPQSGGSFQEMSSPHVSPTERVSRTIRVKQEPSESLSQHWETQWQDFLKNMETPHPQRKKPAESWGRRNRKRGEKRHVLSSEGSAEEDEQETPPFSDISRQEACGRPDTIIVVDETKVKEESMDEDPESMEAQRQRFRQLAYCEGDGPRVVCAQLWFLCHQWLNPERHTKGQILELLVLEQLLTILPPEIQRWVREHGAETCVEAVALAEEFLLRQERDTKLNVPVTSQNVPINSLEAEQAPSVAREMLRSTEVKEEGSGNANCMGDGQRGEVEKTEVQIPKLLNVCGKGKESEEESSSDRPVSATERRSVENAVPQGVSGDHSKLTSQRKTPKGKQEQTCSVCGKSFSWRSGLLAHERVHTGEKPYKCPQCGRSFRSKSTLVVHQRTHTGEKPYQCQECGKTFPVTTQLIEHKRTHSGEKPFQCLECGQAFRQRSNLKNHQKIHTGLKPFKCSYCGKGFSKSSDLIRHERAHTGEKPYQCPDCGKRFCNNSQVITHRRVHTGEKPYKCLECGKGFTVTQQLIRHQAVHTGEKPYQCLECGKTFGVSTLLARHLRIHTGEKPYECSECGKCFRLSSTFIKHLKIHTRRKV